MAAQLRPQMHQARKSNYSGGRSGPVSGEATPLLTNGNGAHDSGADPSAVSSAIGRRRGEERRFWGDGDPSPLVAWPKKFAHLTWLTLASNYVNVLLVFVPVGIVVGALELDPIIVFCMNFLAIIPLASLLSFATEELSSVMGQTIGGLMNASFGNAVELIVSIAALIDGQIRIVQASMLGSILSNILLVLGCCFVAGGINGGQQSFNATAANTMSGLMAVASMSLIIPAALSASLPTEASSPQPILVLSRGTAIILLILYLFYLYFQLRSHASLFDKPPPEEGAEEEEEEEERLLDPIPASIALALVTVLVAVCAEYLVSSIDSFVERTGVSKTFIGIILLPIVGNAAEHVTACIVAYKNKMDLAIGVAIGSSLQIALFVTPFMVILGWIINQPMTLFFHGFETVVFFISTVVVNYLIMDGESNYLEGVMCIGTYLILAIAFYIYPEDHKDIGGMVWRFFNSGS